METQPPTQRRLRFTIGGLLLLTLVASGMAAAMFYLVRGLGIVTDAGINWAAVKSPSITPRLQLTFILFTLASPLLLMVVISSLLSIVQWMRKL